MCGRGGTKNERWRQGERMMGVGGRGKEDRHGGAKENERQRWGWGQRRTSVRGGGGEGE